MSKWTIQDRHGHSIYLTEERWQHVLESRPELGPYLDEILDTLRTGRRKQDPLVPNEYRYYKPCARLLPENNHLVVVVIFKTRPDDRGQFVHNNFVVTAWANYIYSRR
jgi:hypothetical protein